VAFSRVLAEEIRGDGVRVGVVVAGATDTPLWDTIPNAPDRGRMLRPEDVARAVVLMAALPPRAALEELAGAGLARAEPDPLIGGIVAELRSGASVAATAGSVGLNERGLHRRCLAAFGYGPKTLARILRMNRALDLARAGTPFATVAVTAGYADQAHLAREVRALAGVPLGELT